MKVELKQKEVTFEPIKIEVTIESLEELKALRIRTALRLVEIMSHISDELREDINFEHESLQLKNLLDNLKNVTI